MRTALATTHATTMERSATIQARPRLVVIENAGGPADTESLAFLRAGERRALSQVLQRSGAELQRFIRRRVMCEVLGADEPMPPSVQARLVADQDAAIASVTPWRQRALLEREIEDIEAMGRSDDMVVARLGRRISGAVVLGLHIGLLAERGGGAWSRTLERQHSRMGALLSRARAGDGRARLIARLACEAARDRILAHVEIVDHQLRLEARRDMNHFEGAIGHSLDGAQARAVLTEILAAQRWLHLRSGAARASFRTLLEDLIPAGTRGSVEAALD